MLLNSPAGSTLQWGAGWDLLCLSSLVFIQTTRHCIQCAQISKVHASTTDSHYVEEITMKMVQNKNIFTVIRSWPTSCSTFTSYHMCFQHNERWVLTTGYDDRILLTTPAVWLQTWTGARINNWTQYIKPEYLVGRLGTWMCRQNQQCQCSIVTKLRFQDTTTGRITDDGQTDDSMQCISGP